MTESTKTILLIAVAAAVLVLAVITRPKPPAPPADTQIGESLFAKLDDPLKAKRMRIVTYDDATGKAREFEVAQVNGVWSLPSHKDYPADATEQMAAAATALVDLEVRDVASEGTTDQELELYGVVEPDPVKNQFGQPGIGKLVIVEDESGKPLARLIIGKEDKPTSADDFNSSQAKLRFVRVPGQSRVYRAALASDKFSTKFENWIETDLLKLNPLDVSQVELRDYSIEEAITSQGQIVPTLQKRADIDLAFNDRDSKWSLEKLVEYKNGEATEEKLEDDEELNTARLNEMKNALDNLKIVNVERKPDRMSANMKAEKEFLQDFEALRDLMRRGFVPEQVGDDQLDIKARDGEVVVAMKDGVEYVLRFGGVAGVDDGGGDDEQDEKTAGADNEEAKETDESTDDSTGKTADLDPSAAASAARSEGKSGASLNRYVMVMAQFNPDLIPKPELEPLPEIKTAPEKSADASDSKSDAETGADKKGESTPTADDKSSETTTDEKNEADKTDDAKTEDAKSDDAQSGSKKTKDAAEREEEEEDLELLEARREKIEKENRRKQDEYDEKVKKGQDRARELNARFADWYYVINDATYRKIHLGVGDIIQKKSKEEDENAADTPPPSNPFPPVPATPANEAASKSPTGKE